LKHSVYEVCELVKPIIPNIEPNKYLAYFLANIDFDNIDNNPNREIGLKNCTLIYFGLDQLLKIDIDKGISEFQLNLSSLNSFKLKKFRMVLVILLGF
jgi:hypothetical protein